jgi:hypothetical protein
VRGVSSALFTAGGLVSSGSEIAGGKSKINASNKITKIVSKAVITKEVDLKS